MNCQEFEEHITPAVDQYLQGSEKSSFHDHASRCPQCRRAFEAERFVKTFVQKRLHIVHTPRAVTDSIMEGTRTRVPGVLSPMTRWQPFRQPASLRYLIAAAATVVVAYLFFSVPAPDATLLPAARADVLSQSALTYAGILAGQLKPQIESPRPEVLEAFFSGKTGFPVHVPDVRDYTPVGALLNETSGVPLAHLVYAGGGNTVYIYQTCWTTVQDGQKLDLPERIKDILRTGRPYVEEDADGRTLVLWTEGRTLCGAIAQMHKQDLLSHLPLAQASLF